MRTRLLTVLALALAAAATAPAQANYAGGNGKIAFAEWDTGEFESRIATVNADGTGYQQLGPGREPTWSPGGDRIAFEVMPRGGSSQGGVAVMNADGTGVKVLTDRRTASEAAWSPDGEQLALLFGPCGCIAVTRVDGSESRLLYRGNPQVVGDVCGAADLEWAPTGNTIAFSGRPCTAAQTGGDPEIFVIQSDGTGLAQITDETGLATDPEWSPDGERIVYGLSQSGDEDLISIRPDGTDRTTVYSQGRDPTWAPDRGEVAFVLNREIYAARTNHVSIRQILTSETTKSDLDWQRVSPGFTGHARPKSATPAEFSLVPTYYRCEAPNREHGPPLAFGSCSPPVPGSEYLTVGTPDANGAAPFFTGGLRYVVMPGNPATPVDEADVKLEASLSDIRCRVAGPACVAGALSDFGGKLRLRFAVRITDRLNELGHSITMQDPVFMQADIPCSVTPGSIPGSDCGLATTLDAVVPGVVPEGKRAIWQLDQITLFDGGPNGDHSAGAPTQFAAPGIFVP